MVTFLTPSPIIFIEQNVPKSKKSFNYKNAHMVIVLTFNYSNSVTHYSTLI